MYIDRGGCYILGKYVFLRRFATQELLPLNFFLAVLKMNIWLDEKLASPSISRHGKAQASSLLPVWLDEIVR